MESNKAITSDTPGDTKKQANSPTAKDDVSTVRGSFTNKRTSSISFRVNPENVVKQGLLFK